MLLARTFINLNGYFNNTQCDLKITELFSYRIKQAWYYVAKLILIENRIHFLFFVVRRKNGEIFYRRCTGLS